MADAVGLDEEGRIRKAHAKTGCVYARNPGYHLRKTSSQSPLSTRVRICSSKWAPRWLQRICCFFTMRLLTTWFTVDSTNPVLIRSPLR